MTVGLGVVGSRGSVRTANSSCLTPGRTYGGSRKATARSSRTDIARNHPIAGRNGRPRYRRFAGGTIVQLSLATVSGLTPIV